MGLGDDILAAMDLPRVPVDLPLWGPAGTFFIRSLTMDAIEQYQLDCYKRTEGVDGPAAALGAKAFLVTLTLEDAEGNLIFTAEQAKALGGKSASMVTIAAEAASKHNGMSKADVEDLEKNSESSRSGSS